MEKIRSELNATAYTQEDKLKAQQDARNIVKDYSDELVEQYNKEIDGLLTFVSLSHPFRLPRSHSSLACKAGLFSAVCAGFLIEVFVLVIDVFGVGLKLA